MSDQQKRLQRGRTCPPRQPVPEAPEGCSIVDEVCAADAQWFLDHPGATEYERPYVPGEMPVDPGPGVIGVRVERIADGVRLRTVLVEPSYIVLEPRKQPRKRR